MNAGTTISAKFMFISPELKEEYTRVTSMHSFTNLGEPAQAVLNFTVDLVDTTVEEVISKIDGLVKSENFNEEIGKRISYVADGHKLSLAFGQPRSIFSHVDPSLQETLSVLQDQIKAD